jgi:hypothetical protein
MFELAHSLGYPHPDLMLAQMTSIQFTELLMFFRIDREEKERLRAEAEESRLRHHMSKVIARQQRGSQ